MRCRTLEAVSTTRSALLIRRSRKPPGLTTLARFTTVAKAQAVARMPLERRMAALLAFVRTLEATDVLELFDIVVTALFNDAAKVGRKARLPKQMARVLRVLLGLAVVATYAASRHGLLRPEPDAGLQNSGPKK